MAIRIEILSVQPTGITVAFYYPVPANIQSTAANDQARVPAGNGLSAAELQELKDGTLFEHIKTLDPQSMSLNEVKQAIENLWSDSIHEAKSAYMQLYSYINLPNAVGKTWDGTTWS
jgi:hypothetical protein